MSNTPILLRPVGEVIAMARRYGLVPVDEVMPGVRRHLPYATPDNFTGAPLYPADMPCLLQQETAERLAAARAELRRSGRDLLIWDAWRPVEASQLIWNHVRDPAFANEPGKDGRWSRHCYGLAIDLTLTDEDGTPARMPSGFDDFTGAGAADYTGDDPGVATSLRLLQQAMTGAGFRALDTEWWHFSDPLTPVPECPVRGHECGIFIPVP